MPPDSSLPSECDEPLDAIVDEDRPSPAPTFQIRPQDIYRPPTMFRFEAPLPAQYVVPRRFGMSAILGIITALAILFGCFRAYEVHPVLYLFFGIQAIVICLAQMFYGQTPRAASAVAGGVILPLFIFAAAYMLDPFGRVRAEEFSCLLVGSIPIGAFFGYITGTLAAGVFLVMDSVERMLASSRPAESRGGSRR
jgi:hypothetical protein